MHQLQQKAHCEVPIHHPPLENWLQQDLFESPVAQELPIVNLLHSPTWTTFLHLFRTKISVVKKHLRDLLYCNNQKAGKNVSNYEAQMVGCEGCVQNLGLSHDSCGCLAVVVCVWPSDREVAALKFEPEPLIWVMGFRNSDLHFPMQKYLS